MRGLFQCPPRARSFWAFSPYLNHMAFRRICNPALKNVLTYLCSADLQSAAKEYAFPLYRVWHTWRMCRIFLK